MPGHSVFEALGLRWSVRPAAVPSFLYPVSKPLRAFRAQSSWIRGFLSMLPHLLSTTQLRPASLSASRW